jgi:hypothetical protein
MNIQQSFHLRLNAYIISHRVFALDYYLSNFAVMNMREFDVWKIYVKFEKVHS